MKNRRNFADSERAGHRISKIEIPNPIEIFTSPTWRHDIAIEEDLVEEVARIVGYDKIGEELAAALSARANISRTNRAKIHLRQTLANLGFDEAISYSFIDTQT